MNLKAIKKEVLDIILQSNLIEKNEIDVDFIKSLNKKYSLVINKIKKNIANKNNYCISGFICVDIESDSNNNFIFLGKMLSKLNTKNCISTIFFSDSVKIINNNDSFNENNYLKCNFKGSLHLENNPDEICLNNLMFKQENKPLENKVL